MLFAVFIYFSHLFIHSVFLATVWDRYYSAVHIFLKSSTDERDNQGTGRRPHGSLLQRCSWKSGVFVQERNTWVNVFLNEPRVTSSTVTLKHKVIDFAWRSSLFYTWWISFCGHHQTQIGFYSGLSCVKITNSNALWCFFLRDQVIFYHF